MYNRRIITGRCLCLKVLHQALVHIRVVLCRDLDVVVALVEFLDELIDRLAALLLGVAVPVLDLDLVCITCIGYRRDSHRRRHRAGQDHCCKSGTVSFHEFLLL